MLGRVSAFSTAVATISVAPGQLLFGQVIDMGVPIGNNSFSVSNI